MWPTWWWPQALMQPEILIFSSPISLLAVEVGEAAAIAWAIGIERAVASAQ